MKVLSDKMREWRHHLHRNPELSSNEFETAAFIAKELRAMGIEVAEGVFTYGLACEQAVPQKTQSISAQAQGHMQGVTVHSLHTHTLGLELLHQVAGGDDAVGVYLRRLHGLGVDNDVEVVDIVDV